MRIRKLNELCDQYAHFDSRYVVADDGHLYRQLENGDYRKLKSGYSRSKNHPYQQVRGPFGTGKNHTVKVHKAVALAFCPKPPNATDVDHINNIKTDNRADNLRWITHQENLKKKSSDAKKTLEKAGMVIMLMAYTAMAMWLVVACATVKG